jgi:hypothetical protein
MTLRLAPWAVRPIYTPQSSLLVALHLIPSWGSGMFYGFPISFPIANLGGVSGKSLIPFKLLLVIYKNNIYCDVSI